MLPVGETKEDFTASCLQKGAERSVFRDMRGSEMEGVGKYASRENVVTDIVKKIMELLVLVIFPHITRDFANSVDE